MKFYRYIKIKLIIGIVLMSMLALSGSYISFEDSFLEEGTTLSFELLDRNSGLSNLSVSSIIQDKYGFIWFGTQGGLNSYDGREMKIVRNDPFDSNGLVHNLIQTMYYDEENHEIWIGTYQGISRYLIAENRFINYTVDENGLSNSVVIAILKDDEGFVWAGTMEGLNRIDPVTGEIEIYEIEDKVVRDLLMDSSGRMLIGSHAGLMYYDKDSDSIKNFNLELPSPYVMVLGEFKIGRISMGLWDGGLVEIDIDMTNKTEKNFEDNRVYSLIQTDDGTKWVGTWGGGLFAIYPNGKEEHFKGDGRENALVHPVVYSLLQDDTGILWIGTNGGGICKVNPRKRNYVKLAHDPEDESSLSQGKIIKIFEDSDYGMWYAIYNNGLNYYNPQNKELKKFINDPDDISSIQDNQITEIIELDKKKLLMGTGNGMSIFDMKTEMFSRMDILPEGTLIYALEKDIDNRIWIGTYRNGLYLYDFEEGIIKQYKNDDTNNTISDNLIYDIHRDTKGWIWVATNKGLNVLRSGEENFRTYLSHSGDYTQIASNTIRVLFEDSKDRMWVGTVGGGVALYDYERDNFKNYTEAEGLSNNIVMGIIEGDDGRIWLSTQNGISIINPENEAIFVLTPDDGIGGWEFNAGYAKDHLGNMLFGSMHGVTSIPSKFENVNIKPPSVYITDVTLFQKSIDENKLFFNDESLEFGPQESHIGFKVVALDYDSPEKINFFYKLEGFDDKWINNGTRDYISYSLLEAGDYVLKVVTETSENIKSDEVSVNIKIRSPWYKHNMAYVIYVILFIIFVKMIIKIREAQLISKKNSELAVINNKLNDANMKLESLSTIDSLTGLYNRRYFDIILEEQLSLATRSNINIALMMIDIDGFKGINDNYGHVAGDYFLKDMSWAIVEVLHRRTDFATRYGGDEFAIVLYDTDIGGAIKIANVIKESMSQVRVRSEYEMESVSTTVSMGVVSLIPDKDINTKVIIEYADKALYKAKSEGKNCICSGETYN
ncbi:MAG: diguanylate cyclase [Acidaminobacteraceae bacterium]